MQDRYTGDLGDFSKLGILRALQAAGLSIGVNWYLTPDESHNGDGRHVKYLRQEEFKACDKVLWQELKNIVDSNHRKVCYLENGNILPACFYSERLDFSGKVKAERESFRKEWHKKALAALIGNSIVCLDPDNGLIVPSAVGKSKENKYVLHDELADYYAQQSSVIYYQHKARKTDQFYIRQHEEMIHSQRFPHAKCRQPSETAINDTIPGHVKTLFPVSDRRPYGQRNSVKSICITLLRKPQSDKPQGSGDWSPEKINMGYETTLSE